MEPVPRTPALPTTYAYDRSTAEQGALREARTTLIWGWCLVGGGCLLALAPVLGMLAWFIGPPLVVAGFVLAIVSIVKGRTGGGVALMLFTLIVAPVTLIFGPIVMTMIAAALAADRAAPKMEEMMEALPEPFPGTIHEEE